MYIMEKIDENNEILYLRMKLPLCAERDNISHVTIKNISEDS